MIFLTEVEQLVIVRRLLEDKLIRKIFAFANNHYAARPGDSKAVLAIVEPTELD